MCVVRGDLRTFFTCCLAVADAKQKGKADKKEDESTLLDDTLKCAICFNLCERPITVGGRFYFVYRVPGDVVTSSGWRHVS